MVGRGYRGPHSRHGCPGRGALRTAGPARQPLAGRWRAALATYFIGTCLFAFADVYRRRLRSWQQDVALASALASTLPPDLPDVAGGVVADDAAQTFLDETTDRSRLRLVVFLYSSGWTCADIASALADGTTARAVEGCSTDTAKQFRPRGEVDPDDC